VFLKKQPTKNILSLWQTVKGSGIVAGGPYYCAQGDVEIALNACMVIPGELGVCTSIPVDSQQKGAPFLFPRSHQCANLAGRGAECRIDRFN
jgi:hypothetical protein